MNEAAAAQRYERAAVLLRRRDRLAALVGRMSGVLEAPHARSRLVLAKHPSKERWDAFWVIAGRVADWGELPRDPDELAERTRFALERRPPARRAALVAPEEVDEVRIVQTWVAAHEPPALELGAEPPGADELADFVERATGELTAAVPAAILAAG